MIRAHGYIRVSHAEQAESGLSLEAQRQECHRYWERFLKPKAVAWADLIADEAISAFKRPLAKRKGRQQLLAILRQQRRPRGGKRPFGYSVAGPKGHRHLVLDRDERAILVRIIKAVDGFWRLVHTEGTDWISDPATKGQAMMKMAAAVSQASKRTV